MVCPLKRKKLCILALFFALALLGACDSQERVLPFETIEQDDLSVGYESEKPSLAIVASVDEADQLNGLITPEALIQLGEVDYSTHFATVAFLGLQPTGHRGFRIERVVRQGDTVSVFVQPGYATGETEVTSPYHLVKVQKDDWKGGEIDIALVVEDVIVFSQLHDTP